VIPLSRCENCDNLHDRTYGSGRFCNSKCARGFSTKEKRKEINEIVSKKLMGNKSGKPFKKGQDERRRNLSDEDRRKAVIAKEKAREELYASSDFIDLPMEEKRRIVLREQNEQCGECGIAEWNGKPIVLELHHINGDNSINTRNNLVFLCPNCHSQTDSWRIKKSAR
jgi:5-methylcytosine-specific restriction endonuclease McrA